MPALQGKVKGFPATLPSHCFQVTEGIRCSGKPDYALWNLSQSPAQCWIPTFRKQVKNKTCNWNRDPQIPNPEIRLEFCRDFRVRNKIQERAGLEVVKNTLLWCCCYLLQGRSESRGRRFGFSKKKRSCGRLSAAEREEIREENTYRKAVLAQEIWSYKNGKRDRVHSWQTVIRVFFNLRYIRKQNFR